MSLPNPVEQKSYDVINNKLSRVMKEVAEESMKRAAVEENSSSPDNLLTVSGDGTWKTRGHSSLIGVCTVIGAETAGHPVRWLKTFCAKMSLPNPVEQKSYDVINNKLSRVMKEVAEESMKRAAVEENSSSPDNL
ncbi:hypothetical protein TNCV_3166201 [Trichonephila clavipes]|uniref:Mutator-like transposase domain-containing protein n=1 Tax=Trichonephila clavipes TaxID=2585209 RepID=A0A8X6REL1_TRICX|nr:hypothetical protein TNCV_3166201 [Trichonephila clavipes]